jgi:hypothetical protein
MDNSWIKLYRKILRNDEIFGARNAFPVLCWLLLLADHNTGTAIIGRNMGARWLKITPSSFYRALKKLEAMKIIVLKADSKRTTITFNNWFIYQSKTTTTEIDLNSKRTANEQQMNTIQEYRIRNIKEKEINKEKERNPIIEDPIFKRLKEVYIADTDAKVRQKMDLETRLSSKYSDYRYQPYWRYARQELKGSLN